MPSRCAFLFGPFRLDTKARILLRDGTVVPLTPKAVEILLILVESAGKLVDKDELMKAVWADTFVEESNLTQNISLLRKTLCELPGDRSYIETIPKRGYRFVAPVTEQSDEPGTVPDTPSPMTEPVDRALRSGSPRLPSRTSRILWASAVLAVLMAAGFSWYRFSRRVGSEQPVVLVGAVPLTTFAGALGPPAFSPDATRIAFSWIAPEQPGSGPHLYVKLVGPGEPQQLTTSPGSDLSPAWSPDGTYIAFLRVSPGGKAAVTLIPALGGPERKLTEVSWAGSELFPPHLTWSPDSRQLVIVDTVAPGGPRGLFMLSIEDGQRRSLIAPPADSIGDSSPAFAPDGRALAFIRSPSYTVGDIYLLPLSVNLTPAGNPERLTFDNRRCFGLAWTPDGRDIVFSSNRLGISQLWRISRSRPKQPPELLPSLGDGAEYPAISRPNGARAARLVYRKNRADRNIWQIGVSPNGGNLRLPAKLIASTRDDLSPRYSPDGKRIALTSSRSGGYEIWVCDNDGTRPVKLTSFGGPVTDHPWWSPDGMRITFHSRPEGRSEIYVIDAAGGQPQRLTYGPGDNTMPSWSHDGKWIYFGSNRTGRYEIWKISASGGSAVQVTKTGGIVAIDSPDGNYLYYTKGRGISSLWRAPIAGGPEIQIVAASLVYLNFAVKSEGVYLIPEPASGTGYSIQLLTFAGGLKTVASIANTETIFSKSELGRIAGIEVSPDASWILYSRWEEPVGELMLGENFH